MCADDVQRLEVQPPRGELSAQVCEVIGGDRDVYPGIPLRRVPREQQLVYKHACAQPRYCYLTAIRSKSHQLAR
jgi:hypothetical protein